MAGSSNRPQPYKTTFGVAEKDYLGTKVLNFSASQDPYMLDSQNRIVLDTAARSVGVDLGAVYGMSEIKLTPQASQHRVQQRNIRVFVTSDPQQANYTEIKGFKFTQNATDGSLLIQFSSVVQGRFVKVKTDWDDRDLADAIVQSFVTFVNYPNVLFQVVVLKTSQDSSYAYDNNGNRLTATVDGDALTVQYYKNAAGGDLSLIRTDGTWNYKYDQNGNLLLKAKALLPGDPYSPGTGIYNTTCDTTKEYWSYSWDLNNRLLNVQHFAGGSATPNQTDSYVYDTAGLRVQRTGSDGSTFYMYSNGTLVYSKNATTGLTRTIAYMGSTILGWTDAQTGTSGTVTAKYYASTDQLGSVTQITDINANIVWSSEYTPFGGLAGSRGTYSFSGLFTGKDIDADTGLYYYNARWYDAGLGRFISEDPAGQGTNWYAYGGSNPLTNIDPSGKDWGSFWSAVGVYTAAFATAFIPGVGPYISAAIIGAYAGGTAANGGNGNIGQWSNDSQTWAGILIGAALGVATAGAGQATMTALGATGTGAALAAAYPLQTAASGAVSGFVAGYLNSWAFGDMKDGFFHGSLQQNFEAGLVGAVAGFATGYLGGAIQHSMTVQARTAALIQQQGMKELFGDPQSFRLSQGVAVAAGGQASFNDSEGLAWDVGDKRDPLLNMVNDRARQTSSVWSHMQAQDDTYGAVSVRFSSLTIPKLGTGDVPTSLFSSQYDTMMINSSKVGTSFLRYFAWVESNSSWANSTIDPYVLFVRADNEDLAFIVNSPSITGGRLLNGMDDTAFINALKAGTMGISVFVSPPGSLNFLRYQGATNDPFPTL